MGCPVCGSSQVCKDYAPARGYVLAAAGLGLLFLRAFFSPEILSPVLASEEQRLLLAGVLVFGYGAYNLLRHGNRFCGDCGFRFRATSTNQGAIAGVSDISHIAAAQAARSGSSGAISEMMHGRGDAERAERKRGAIRYEPVLACLKFKNPQQRAEASRTLVEATGKDFGEDYDAWRVWLLENKKIRS